MQFDKYPKILNNDQRSKKLKLVFGLILVFIGVFIVVASFNIYKPNLIPNKLRFMSLGKVQNILILGCDEIYKEHKKEMDPKKWRGRSDTIVVLKCDPRDNSLSILNIPRDTKINISKHGFEKINFLNSIGGPIFTRKCIERLLSIKIDHFVIVDVHGLNRIIDEIGGISINVPQRMKYTDVAGMLKINLFPGNQILSGEQAVGFIRYRHDGLGDIGRIKRQQLFIKALIKKLLDPIIFTRIPDIVSVYKETILTDLKTKDIIKIANFVRGVPTKKRKISILPGDFGQNNSSVSYWIPDQEKIDSIVKEMFK